MNPDAAAGIVAPSVPFRKRKLDAARLAEIPAPPKVAAAKPQMKKAMTGQGRQIRLEQNRKAARESRRRKKVMIEELQRSVIFFSRANATLKQQNDDFSKMLMQAQTKIAHLEEQEVVATTETSAVESKEHAVKATQPLELPLQELEKAPAVVTNAQSAVAPPPVTSAAVTLPQSTCETAGSTAMQTGATMHAMANFQQAAAVAIEAAMKGMQTVPGLDTAQPPTAQRAADYKRVQQAYADAMTAVALQQAAAGAAVASTSELQTSVNGTNPFLPYALLAWQKYQQQGSGP